MHRSLPVLLVALLLVGSTTVVVAGQGHANRSADSPEPALLEPVEGTSPNTTRVLRLDSVTASDFQRGELSVTNALQAQTGNTEGRLRRYAIETRLDAAADSDEREAILLNATDQIARRLDALQTREAAARQRFITGEATAASYVRTLGEINIEAKHVESTLLTIDELGSRYAAVGAEVDDLRARAIKYTGPVKDPIGQALTGAGETGEFYVGVSAQGVELATIRNGVFVRETIRVDARDDASDGIDLDAAQARIMELYPWGWPNRGAVSIRSIGRDVFRFQLNHDHGSLDSLLDTTSRNVYREVQTKTLSNLPTANGSVTTANNTTLIVSRTYAGGPLKIQVQNATGAPVRADISLNETQIGTTDEDGTIWALSPAGSYNVSARHEEVELNVTVVPR